MRAALGLVSGLLLTALATLAAQTREGELPKGPTTIEIAKGSRLEFKGVNGDVLITKATGTQAVITYAKNPDAADVKVFLVRHDQGVTICTVHPAKDPKKPTECLPGKKGRLADGNPKDRPAVRFKLELPAGVDLAADLGFGNMRSESVPGNLSLYSNRGSLAVIDGGVGTILAEVGLLGNIDALISSARGQSRAVTFKAAGSGQIRVALPLSVNVFYSISTQSTPTIDPAFKFEKKTGPVLVGHLGPGSSTDVNLKVDTGIAGRFVLRRAN